MTTAIPELLLPAGDLDRMRAAFDFGADAVYAGQPRYSLRARNNDFKLENLKTGIREAHTRGKKLFVASNILAHNNKIKSYLADMEEVIALNPDALIMADPGLIMMVREKWPELSVHLSVQSNTVNYATVKFWQKIGLTRVILSRELSLDEISQIRQECPDMEIEVFVHGALCIAYSGRCLLSGYFNHRDANQGTCTNACRWDYKMANASEDESGQVKVIPFEFNKALRDAEQSFSVAAQIPRHPLADQTYLIEEANRPGELMPIAEDEYGTYIMNSKDLRAVEYVEKLVKIGVDSLKIEGRTKSQYYVSRAAQVYRQAIDDAVAGKPFNPALLADLDGLSNRGYTTGFYERHRSHETQNYLDGHSKSKRSIYVGKVNQINEGWATVEVKNKFSVGDTLELIHPQGNRLMVVETIRDKNGVDLQVALGSGIDVLIPLESQFEHALISRILTEAD
ncbi:putative protease [Collimonas sp. OK242]|uniref:prephenate-dependent tRNA uridine(34) hydroxylase TrhP n=1 Tax=Collimonas sp. OK242 TaxID=1798195 RepID=UPI0008984CF7|nr:tRNA 5-hydroxyuridine modification protein YegQ [Collimonas sp. OK242]SDY45522.1 putative protease [Collimonas sp. OK242]